MNWGERSCVFLYTHAKPCKPSILTCNVNCPYYQWDGISVPDSKKLDLDAKIKPKDPYEELFADLNSKLRRTDAQ